LDSQLQYDRAMTAVIRPLVVAWWMILSTGCDGDLGSTPRDGALPDGPAGADGSGSGPDGGSPPPPSTTCTIPIRAQDVSRPTSVVGSGTPASCTEQAFAGAVRAGGVITFNCGGPATIRLSAEQELPIDKDTILDGGGIITLDGGGTTRLLRFYSPNYRATRTRVALQHLTLIGGKATGTPIPPAPPPCSQGFNIDGGGAAIFVRDGILHVVDVTFRGNQGAQRGPDVAGAGVYAVGSLEVTIVGSRFEDNTASNGGAVGSLNSNLTLVGNVFLRNHATGSGANYIDPQCAVGGGESGDGGNGGAVVMDGGEEFAVTLCGNVFQGGQAGALGGAVFRTPDINRQTTRIDQSSFDGNAAKGGGALYFHNSNLFISASTFSNNSAQGAGAIQADDTNIDFTNLTFAGNSALMGIGGAMSIFSGGGTITNCTFANNHSDGGAGFFAAAIAGGLRFIINNSIFWNNTSRDANSPMTCQGVSDGTATSDLQWPQNHLVGGAPDDACVTGIRFADANLGALAPNGGPTQTMVPPAGSPALGIGRACPPTDQRGQPRRQPDGCTAGAVEVP